MLLPITFNVRAGHGSDHAGRHLLRRPVRRLHDRDPHQPPGRVVIGGDGDRRPRDGARRAGPGRRSPRPRIGSFVAGTVGTLVLVLFAPALASVALGFGSAEFFSLVVLGLIASIALARGSTLKALAMIVLGLLLGTVGQDIYTGTPRFTFGVRELFSGINFVSVAVGMFGVAEILRNLEDEKPRSA